LPAPAHDRGTVVAHYPEWDRIAAQERPDWTTVREVAPALGLARDIDALLERETALRRRVGRLVRGARLGRTIRLKRQPDGPDLDLDATLDAAVAMRVGEQPDERIHRLTATRTRDLAVLLLIDMSQSTADRIAPDGMSVLDVERTAVAVLAQALEALDDLFALRAFASNGRDEVRFVRIADFDDGFDAVAKSRLAGLASGLSTRLGTAIRHAGAELATVRAYRKIVLALTDGEPSDVDVADPLNLVEDAKRAVRDLRRRGIDAFGITLAPSNPRSGAEVFGRFNHMPVRRIEELSARLADLYFRLARR
jgi:nitric oxide reductase activation protein